MTHENRVLETFTQSLEPEPRSVIISSMREEEVAQRILCVSVGRIKSNRLSQHLGILQPVRENLFARQGSCLPGIFLRHALSALRALIRGEVIVDHWRQLCRWQVLCRNMQCGI